MDLSKFMSEIVESKSNNEIVLEVARSKGWRIGSSLLFDRDEALVHPMSDYQPACNFAYTSDLILELDEAGYGITINTRSILDGEKTLLIAAVPYGGFAKDVSPIPMIEFDRVKFSEMSLSTAICRSICALYLAYVLLRGEQEYEREKELARSQ